MMTKKILLLAAAVVMLMGCKKDQNAPEPEPETQTQPEPEPEPATQEQTMQAYFATPVAFNGTFIEVGNALVFATKSQTASAPLRAKSEGETYPIITWTPQDGTWPIDLMVDYGSKGVVSTDGLEHSGKMAIHATARFEQEGAVIEPSFTDFRVYGNVLTAKQVIKNLGKNLAGNLVFDVTVENGLLGEQKEFIYSEHTLRELVNGLQDNGFMNPEVTTHTYSIVGWMKMVSTVDTIPGYWVSIADTVPMVVAVGDLYPTKGDVNITFDEELSYTVQGFTVTYQTVNLSFTGKQGDQYGAIVGVDYKLGPVTQTMRISFLLDENGIIPESIKPLMN